MWNVKIIFKKNTKLHCCIALPLRLWTIYLIFFLLLEGCIFVNRERKTKNKPPVQKYTWSAPCVVSVVSLAALLDYNGYAPLRLRCDRRVAPRLCLVYFGALWRGGGLKRKWTNDWTCKQWEGGSTEQGCFTCLCKGCVHFTTSKVEQMAFLLLLIVLSSSTCKDSPLYSDPPSAYSITRQT